MPRRAKGELADDERAGVRGALQARRRVDDVAGDESLAALRARSQRDKRFAGVDGRAGLETELPGRLEDLQADANGALGVVLVGDRRAENGHHGVTYVLLDYAAEPLDLVAHARVVRLERRVVLRVGGIGFGGEPDEVDEDDRDDLALGLLRRPRRERRRAGETEPCTVRVLLPTVGAGRHRLSVVRSLGTA